MGPHVFAIPGTAVKEFESQLRSLPLVTVAGNACVENAGLELPNIVITTNAEGKISNHLLCGGDPRIEKVAVLVENIERTANALQWIGEPDSEKQECSHRDEPQPKPNP